MRAGWTHQNRPPAPTAPVTAGRAQPHWWAVLAVTLAMMALVAAVPSASHRAPSSLPARRAVRATTSVSVTTPSVLAVTPPSEPATVDSGPGVSGGGVGPSANTPSADAQTPTGSSPTGSNTGPTSAPTQTAPATVPTTTAPTTAPSTAPSTAVAGSTSPGLQTETQQGNLEYPDNVSAQYTVTTSSGAAVSAQWTGTALLTVSVDCPVDHQSETGTLGLYVSATGEGLCTVTVAEPPSVQATVGYVLDLQYQN